LRIKQFEKSKSECKITLKIFENQVINIFVVFQMAFKVLTKRFLTPVYFVKLFFFAEEKEQKTLDIVFKFLKIHPC
jgi:hypothetical protein